MRWALAVCTISKSWYLQWSLRHKAVRTPEMLRNSMQSKWSLLVRFKYEVGRKFPDLVSAVLSVWRGT